MKLTKKDKHLLKYLLKKWKKEQEYLWKQEKDSNNLPYELALVDIDDALNTLLNELGE